MIMAPVRRAATVLSRHSNADESAGEASGGSLPWASGPLIHTRYRPIRDSVPHYLLSLGYLHNETINIFSHLIPATMALFAKTGWRDQLIVVFYLLTSSVCFSTSALYHTFLCHSEQYRDFLVLMDYAVILLQIVGSFVSGIIILSSLLSFVVLNPKLQSKRWRSVRVCSFVATCFSAFAPIIHAAAIFPFNQLNQQAGLRYYYIEGALVLTGTLHYISHFPESCRPGAFDIWGFAPAVSYLCCSVRRCSLIWNHSRFKWNYENPRRSSHAS
ncbi:hemolysin-III related-domain-containing protein [Podospora didyma]|uniref:Hemolysin-III related-domain-containing protein n=1 Tax=Podospora didyma TaxID=330526 RepID=A0AAE0TZT9_9PEZI|nr:hemolysin-III related-domain-containing protein [Podospora didyma]